MCLLAQFGMDRVERGIEHNAFEPCGRAGSEERK